MDGKAADAVREAVKIGYRHIDTAQAYENEYGVGEGIRTCGLAREEVFVTTKQVFLPLLKNFQNLLHTGRSVIDGCTCLKSPLLLLVFLKAII